MADQLYLSYWLHGFTPHNMLRHYEKMLRLFPFSRLVLGAAVFKIIPIAYSEPSRIEQSFSMPDALDDLLASSKEFLDADSCYSLDASWDLLQFENAEWKLSPSRVSLSCFGPAFEDAEEHLRIEFGIEALFLPQAGLPNNVKMAQANIRSLLKLVHDLDDALQVDSRRLWTESGENFSDRLQEALLAAG